MNLDELQIIATVSLDFYLNNIKTINVKQYDTGSRCILISFTDHGKKVTINKDTMSTIVRYKKADGKFGLRDCTILEDGTVLIETNEQMLAVTGRCRLDVAILESSGLKVENYSEVTSFEDLGCAILSTMPLDLNVVATPMNNAELESTYDFSALNMALAETKAAEKDLILKQEQWAEQEEQRQINETERQEAEIQREENVQNTISEFENKVNEAISNANTATQEAQDATQNCVETTNDCIETTNDCVETVNQKMTEVDSIMEEYAEAENARNTNVENAITNCEEATVSANTATENANIATDKAYEAIEKFDQTGVVLKSGSVMTGDLTVPTLYVTAIQLGNALLTYDVEEERIVISYT